MNEVVLIAAFSALVPIFLFLRKWTNKSKANWLLFLFTFLSIATDTVNYFLCNANINNHFVINLYDYLALLLELGFIISALHKNWIYRIFTVFLILILWFIHARFNYKYGFFKMSFDYSYLFSLIICLYSMVGILHLVLSDSNFFNKSKHIIMPLLGLLAFEASCLIPLITNNFELTGDEKIYLYTIYLYTVLTGSIIRNVLFSFYFIREKSIENDKRILSNSVI